MTEHHHAFACDSFSTISCVSTLSLERMPLPTTNYPMTLQEGANIQKLPPKKGGASKAIDHFILVSPKEIPTPPSPTLADKTSTPLHGSEISLFI